MIGQKVAHYRITAAIGAGGMGAVYRATDTRLGREVALKVLPAEMASNPEWLQRFQREARAVAALNHPHVVTIYSVDESEGVHFLTMELVEGESLNRLIPDGGMAVPQLLDIAAGLADGLTAAHEKGIVHRDLKPANAMVTSEGRVKVLDFGLAKVSGSAEIAVADLSTEMKTREGVVMGTMPYMSPEQLQGRPLDHRTDIFSLGVMLYEMASGVRPFRGDSSIDLASAILRDTPRPLGEWRKDLPEELTRIITRCMEKSPANRFPSARDVVSALRSVNQHVVGSIRSSIQSAAAVRADKGFWVAVLPIKYSGANTDVVSLAEGLTEDIATGLSRFSYLRVMSRGATARSVGTAGGTAMGTQLGARYVIEGNIRLAGAKVRLTVQLVDTASGTHLWAETYDRPFEAGAALDLQDDLTARIVGTCADAYGVLARNISDAVRGREPDQLSPYEALMRAFGYHHRLSPADHADAREALELAVDRAPANADCWAMLSWLYSHEHSHGFNPRPDSLGRALKAARRAVDIAPANHLVQQALAVVLFFRKETAACLSAAERAIALNPLDTSNEAIFLITFTGDWERGTALTRRAMELNPHHPRWYWVVLAQNEYRLTNYRAAVDQIVKANIPEIFWSNILLAASHAQLGEFPAARDALRNLLTQKENFAQSGPELLGKWFDPQLVEHLIDGLRKAGLEVEPETSTFTTHESSQSPAPISGAERAREGFWVAVLPFKYGGANAELTALADGLTEDIVTGLSRFSYLRVISRSSTSGSLNESVDVRSAGRQLGARYVMEGSLRQAGTKLRLAVQLVDTTSGAHLWAENFERTFSPESVFELQDDLVPRIVSTVADMYGVLPRSMSESLRGKSDDELNPHEAVLRAFGYMERVTPDEHARVRRILERAVSIAPNQSNAWAMLANLYWEEHAHGLNPQPDPLGRALVAARSAVEAAPSNSLAHYALASTLFFLKDFLAFRLAAERALELNPMDGSVAGLIGNLLAYSGDWERGIAVVDSAMRLNSRHPGWYWFAHFNDAYRQRDYRGALGFALKINLPGNWATHAVTAVAYGQLGMREEARKSLQELLAIRPDFAQEARAEFAKWHEHEPEFLERILDGFRKAGLEIAPEEESKAAAPGLARSSADASGPLRAEEGFWVAVLPFRYGGGNSDLTALADGLTEEIITGLSRFSYLKVIARSSTARYSNDSLDVRSAGKELGARYVMEGSLRHAGTKLRLAVQLIEATTGTHLWAENYERTFSPDALFELQDELVPRIVSTVADTNGILARSMSEAVRGRDPEQLTPYEAVLRSFGYGQRITPEELAAARFALELAVGKAPAYADAWALLAWLNVQDYAQGFNLEADSLASGLTAAQRAVDVAPSNHLAWFGLAQALFFHKEFQSFRNAAERAVALNPMDGNSIAFLGELLNYAGDWDRGLALAARAKQLNPSYPGWYWYADFYDAYRRGDDRAALGFALKINLPGQFFSHAITAAALGQLGETDAASKSVRELLKLLPDFAAVARKVIERWWEPEYIERMIDGWRKAGLEIPDGSSSAPRASSAAAPAQVAPLISGDARAEEGFWVAVLPFKYGGDIADLTVLAEGLTEEIVTGLSRFSYLRVIARSSTARFKNEAVDIRDVGRELGARYVMEGSLRQAGSALRVAVQLVDASTGAHLWAETWDRAFRPEDIFPLQDDLVPRIVSTVADWYGVLPHSMSQSLRSKAPDELSPHEAVLRSFGYSERMTAEEHAAVRAALERAVDQAPGNADCWALLSMVYGEEYRYGFNAQPDPLGRSVQAARRAADAAPSNHFAWLALAQALFYLKEFDAFRSAAERAIALNPMDGYTLARMGLSMAFIGDWERGCELAERATQLNPNHPGWYWAASFNNAYRKGDYRGALNVTVKMNMPGFFFHHLNLAAVYGQLGEREAASKALEQLLILKPDFALEARAEIGKFVNSELVEHFIDGLRKAGLDVPTAGEARPDAGALDVPEAANDAPAVSIAVLPFSDMSAEKDQEYFCEGMAEEIMNALVRIDGIRVASRTSAFRAGRDGGDLPSIARALSVNHILEGSVRTSGNRLRVTAQLTDVASGYQLWSERFDRDAVDVFAIQDEIAGGVVEAVKSRLAPGTRTVHARPQAQNLEAYRLYLKGRHLRYTKNDHGGALLCFEQATALDPSHGPSWVGLADVSVLALAYGLRPPREAYGAAKAALQIAAGLQDESAEALYVEAMIALGERRWKDSDPLLARATRIEPGHVQARCWTGILHCLHGRTEEALEALEQAREIDPLAPYPYAMTGFCLLQARRPEETHQFLDQALAFDGDNILALWVSGAAHTARKQFDTAIALLERAVALSNGGAYLHGTLGWALAEAGKTEDAHAVLAALRARPAPATTALSEAWLLAALGDGDGAFQVLDRACDEKQLLVSFTGLPGFDRLRTDPRFAGLVERMGLAQSTGAVS